MKVNILLFGPLTDITGSNELILEDTATTDELVAKLHRFYPAFSRSKYLIAVNKKTISENTVLDDNCSVALLPPFSGG